MSKSLLQLSILDTEIQILQNDISTLTNENNINLRLIELYKITQNTTNVDLLHISIDKNNKKVQKLLQEVKLLLSKKQRFLNTLRDLN